MVQPIRPGAAIQPSPLVRKPGPVSGPSFAEGLRKAVEASTPKTERVRRFAAESLRTEAGEVRLLESYDDLSADEALFEVQTQRGDCQIILSRSGTLSLVEAP